MSIGKVAYIYGILEGQNKIYYDHSDIDDLEVLWENIYSNWADFEDIKDENEEGYIMAYAERILLERFGVKWIITTIPLRYNRILTIRTIQYVLNNQYINLFNCLKKGSDVCLVP